MSNKENDDAILMSGISKSTSSEPPGYSEESVEIIKIAMKALEDIANVAIKKKQNESDAAAAIVEPPFWDLKGRFAHSNLKKMLQGQDVVPADADTAVNTFTLVVALLLAIPFGVSSSVNMDYWNQLKEALQACDNLTIDEANEFWLHIYDSTADLIYGSAYCAMISIILAVLYYLFRPTDDKLFGKWWNRGKYVVGLIFLGTTITIIFTLTFVGNAMGYYSNTSTRICVLLDSPRYFNSPLVGILLLGLFLFGSSILML
jgi:hypothetical protein